MKRIAKHTVIVLSMAVAIAAGGCVMPVDTIVRDVSSTAWSAPAVLDYDNADTTSLREMTLIVRHDDRMAGDSVTLLIVVCTPDSLRHEESLRIYIPQRNAAAALARETEVPYRRKVRLAKEGTYRIEITPLRTVKGIGAVGMSITKSE